LRKDAGLAKRLNSARVSPLSYAAREGYLHIVRLLLEHGAEPNTAEDDCGSDGLALYWACVRNHIDVARLLLEHGASPHAGLDGCMHCVNITRVYHGDQAKPMEELMREYGAYSQPYEMTVRQMTQAIRSAHAVTQHPEFHGNLMGTCNAKLIDLYIDSDPTALNRISDELTLPLSATLVRRLLARGLDPNRPNWLGVTHLHGCASNGNRAIAKVLLDAGADINARAIEFNDTPLAAAVRSGGDNKESEVVKRRFQMVEFLIKRGAATNLPDDEPWATPLAWARKFGHADIEQILIKHGATG
jgi:ankyrin repeat protein